MLLSTSFLAFTIQAFGIGSAVLFFLLGLPLFLALVVNRIITRPSDPISLWTYAIALFTPLATGAQLTFGVLDVFVPLVTSPRAYVVI